MKTSLQIRSLRAAGLALALGLGLAAASHSAQAATVQITLGGNQWKFLYSDYTPGNSIRKDVTGDGTLDSVYLRRSFSAIILAIAPDDSQNFGYAEYLNSTTIFTHSGWNYLTITDSNINGGAATSGYVQGVANKEGGIASVTITRVVFDDALTTAPSFSESAGPYNEWSPTSTAVPEPGTFLPAAALVMGALLRRRRPRSHRSGRATA